MRNNTRRVNVYPPSSTGLNFIPTKVAIRTRAVEMKIIMMPRADNWPHRPSSAKRKIWTASTSVPGRDSTTDRVSSRTNMVAMRIHPETMPGISNGMTIRRMVVNEPAPQTWEDSSRWLWTWTKALARGRTP